MTAQEEKLHTPGSTRSLQEATTFLKTQVGKEGDVVKVAKTDTGWEVEIEVVEESEHMKKIGIPKPVYDKNRYLIQLDADFAITSYERLDPQRRRAE